MNKLLLITGDLASGKSTYALKLSQYFHIPYFDKDTIKEILGDTIGFTSREENLSLSYATMRIMEHILSRCALESKDIILEANFRKNDLDNIKEIVTMHSYDVLLIILKGDEQILFERYQKRLKEYRHPVHQIVEFNTFDGFKAYLDSQRLEEYPFKSIFIDASSFAYQEDEKYRALIEEFFKKDYK